MWDKKGDERVLSIYLFIIYIIVAIALVSGVIIFYGTPLDIRELEARVLTDRIIYCLVDKGELTGEVLNKDLDIKVLCGLDFKDNTKKYAGEEQYGLKVTISKFESCSKNEDRYLSCASNENSFEYGRMDFFSYCGANGNKIPKCYNQQIYVLNNGIPYLLDISSTVGKVEANVRN
jgi:hypothetical protein